MKRILIVGVSSMIGSNLAVTLRRHHRVLGTYARHRPELDGVTIFRLPLNAAAPIRDTVRRFHPNAVIYCAAQNDERACATDPRAALLVNAEAPEIFAQEIAPSGGQMIFLSSSKVYSGEKGNYREEDATDGKSIYGRTKIQAEERLRTYANTLILRLGTVFGLGPFPERSFLSRLLKDLTRGKDLPLISDEYHSFYSVEEICDACLSFLEASPFPSGILNIGYPRKDTYYSFGCLVAGTFGIDSSTLRPLRGSDFSSLYQIAEHRELDLSLCGEQMSGRTGFRLRPLEQSVLRLKHYLQKGTPLEALG